MTIFRDLRSNWSRVPLDFAISNSFWFFIFLGKRPNRNYIEDEKHPWAKVIANADESFFLSFFFNFSIRRKLQLDMIFNMCRNNFFVVVRCCSRCFQLKTIFFLETIHLVHRHGQSYEQRWIFFLNKKCCGGWWMICYPLTHTSKVI